MNDARFQYLQNTIDLYKKKADELEAMLVSVMSNLEKGWGYVTPSVWVWWKARKAEEEERLRKEEEQRRKVMEQKQADLEKERSGLTRRLQYIEQELAKCTPGTPSGS